MEDFNGYREVIPDQTKPDKWKEFTLNTGGTPSTLQDIKVQQRAGGYSYKTCPDRFIYWRTNHDALELVEQSLSVNLAWSHIKYRFTDTPILEGVSIHETYNSVIVLVATVSSAHRLVFPHPDKLPAQQQASIGETVLPSIFSEASLSAARDPTTYHILTSSPNLPHTGASCLTVNGDALFALALGTGLVLLVHLEPLSGAVTCKELCQDTIVPRFLSGISDALLGRHAEDSVSVSMVLHSVHGSVYLFSVCRDGQLRVWNCDRGQFVAVHDVSGGAAKYAQGGQNHSIRKALGPRGELYLCVFLGFTNGSQLVVVSPRIESGIFQFTHVTTVAVPEGHDLVEVWLGDQTAQRGLWCVWVSGQGETAVSCTLLSPSEWVWAALQPAPPFERNLDPMIDPRQAYLEAIFEPGVFSVADITRALSIYRRSGAGTNSNETEVSAGDLRQNVCLAVEAEIQVQVSEYELTDDEYLEVADRCWSKFYSCCVQYLQTGTAALGLFWLPETQCVAVVKKTGFSLLRPMDPIEALYFTGSNFANDNCHYLMKAIRELDEGDDIRSRLETALDSDNSVEAVFAQVASQVQSEQTGFRQALKDLEMFSNAEEGLDTLTSKLNLLANNTGKGCCEGENIFTSHLGISAVVSTLNQLTSVRLDISRKLLLILELVYGGKLKHTWGQDLLRLCKKLWTLKWLCQAQFLPGEGSSLASLHSHAPSLFLQRFLSAHQGLSQSDLLSSAASVAYAVWPEANCDILAEFLLDTQQYLLLQQLAHYVPHTSWNLILAKAFLEMGEPHKAYDLAASEKDEYFKVIQMFERHDFPHFVIDLARNAIEQAKKKSDPSDLATLHSILFLHHLKLGHWESAYHSLETNPEESRRIDCLGQLVTELVNTRNVATLLEFPYYGLLAKLESFLETRARSLDVDQAALYYNTLFALYTRHENFKKAASVMYELGLRSESTRVQCQSYGACLNALQLINPDSAWIVKPSVDSQDDLEILELKDIQCEYELSKARCFLKDCSPDTGAGEVVAMCVAEGFYKIALQLSHLFRLGYEQPLEALTTACVSISNHDKAWIWLLQNEISDLVVGDANAGTVAWRLLEFLLLKYESEGMTRLHQVVARKIMSHSAFLPHWLQASYKKRNPSELIRLYMRHGNLQEASALSVSLLCAGLGAGREHFNLRNSLVSTAPALWLPLNSIDSLLAELHHQPSMEKEVAELEETIENYLETAKRVSDDKISAVYIR